MCFRFARYSSKQCLVSYDAERPRLLIDSTRRLNRCIDQLAERLIINRFRGEFSRRTPCIDCFLEVHA